MITCPKCGYGTILVKYHGPKAYNCSPAPDSPCLNFEKDMENAPEHLMYTCSNCGYKKTGDCHTVNDDGYVTKLRKRINELEEALIRINDWAEGRNWGGDAVTIKRIIADVVNVEKYKGYKIP